MHLEDPLFLASTGADFPPSLSWAVPTQPNKWYCIFHFHFLFIFYILSFKNIFKIRIFQEIKHFYFFYIFNIEL
jgi:hypothetical protein